MRQLVMNKAIKNCSMKTNNNFALKSSKMLLFFKSYVCLTLLLLMVHCHCAEINPPDMDERIAKIMKDAETATQEQTIQLNGEEEEEEGTL